MKTFNDNTYETLKEYKVTTENHIFSFYAYDLEEAEQKAITLCFPEALDDDLPDLMEQMEITEV